MCKLISIDFVSGLCGAGKTYAAASYLDKLAARGYKILLLQPTLKLVQETVSTTFPAMGVTAKVTEITGRTVDCSVIKALHAHLAASTGGEIVVSTHSAFFGLPHVPNAREWVVVFDEIPAVERHFDFNIPDCHRVLTEHLGVTPGEGDHWLVSPRDRSALIEIARNKHGDQVFEQFRLFADTVLSPHYSTYVDGIRYQHLIEATELPGAKRKLLAHAILKPSALAGFRRAIIMGACFSESMMHLLWSRLSDPSLQVRFHDITSEFRLRYERHENGHLLDIYFGVDAPWSKRLREREALLKDGVTRKTIIDAIKDAAVDLIGAEAVAVFANADVTDSIFENEERLPNVSHGLNTYQHIDHAFLVAAHNPPPAHFAFLQKCAKVEPDEIQTALTRQNTYQAANRTSIRDPSSTTRKRWIVADSMTATWLQGLYPGASIHSLDLFHESEDLNRRAGRPRAHESAAERQKAYRERKGRREAEILTRLIRVDLLNGTCFAANASNDLRVAELRAEMEARELTNIRLSEIDNPSEFQGTFFASKMGAGALSGLPLSGTFDDLVTVLRGFARDSFSSKDEVPVYAPAHYVDRDDVETSRGYANIAFARNVVLDFDGHATLTPDHFAALMPHWRMVIHSSWSHTTANPKWRVIIPTDMLMDVEGYRVVTGHIMDRLNDAGVYSLEQVADDATLRDRPNLTTHNFDRTKLIAANVVHVPCARAGAFFLEFGGEGRSALNVFGVLKQATVPDDIVFVESRPIIVDLQPLPTGLSPDMAALATSLRARKENDFTRRKGALVETALAVWQGSDKPGQRDAGLCALAVALRSAGCDATEMVDHLTSAVSASGTRNNGELRAKARRLVKTMGRAAR